MNEMAGKKKNSSVATRCPSCDSAELQAGIEREEFEYGTGQDAKKISVTVPTLTCSSCGLVFTDARAEKIKNEAICRTLGLMTPAEISAIRKQYSLSRAQFAQVSRIGEASIGRWEAGALLQSEAYDNYLFLLRDPENLRRIQARKRDGSPDGLAQRSQNAKFRVLRITTEIESAANQFSLRPSQATCT
jgi:putative zinc finger/helix-turn-helix YgiT family protein